MYSLQCLQARYCRYTAFPSVPSSRDPALLRAGGATAATYREIQHLLCNRDFAPTATAKALGPWALELCNAMTKRVPRASSTRLPTQCFPFFAGGAQPGSTQRWQHSTRQAGALPTSTTRTSFLFLHTAWHGLNHSNFSSWVQLSEYYKKSSPRNARSPPGRLLQGTRAA